MAIIMLGALLGAAFTGVLIGKQIDDLYIENRSLRDNLLTADKQIKQLQETHQPVKKKVISSISTYVTFAEESAYTDFEKSTIELTVEKNIREWLGVISGQDVDDANHLLVPGIINNREIEIENKRIRLAVNLVVISETVCVYVEVIPLKNKI
jgi:hypothetical protein